MTTPSNSDETDHIVADGLRRLADDEQALWEVARAAIEDALIEWRDSRLLAEACMAAGTGKPRVTIR